MNFLLNKFKTFQIGITELKDNLGRDLHNIKIKAEIIYSKDVIIAIKKYTNELISKQDLLNWVNIIWFTDLYEYYAPEEESIASVMTLLETIDEEDVCFSEADYTKMVDCLKNNKECNI